MSAAAEMKIGGGGSILAAHPVYLDNHLLVVNKPPGILSQADRTGDPDLLTFWKSYLKKRFDKPGNVYLGLVHRLDRPASGLMVFARTSKAAARLAQQFRDRSVIKEYRVLVEGDLPDAGAFEDFLVNADGRVRTGLPTEAGARTARLTWKSLSRLSGVTLVHVQLHTGRKHQIRVQFSSRGYPVVGDFRYGSQKELDGRNLALHACRLRIQHPTLKSSVEWTAPVPTIWPEPFRRQ